MARDRAARPEAKPLRLFVAVDVPDVAKRRLAEATGPFREGIPGSRWTRPEGWHVTMKFLGWTWPRLVDEVQEAVAGVAARTRPFESALSALGVFPSTRRARVVWAGLADPDGRFVRLAGLLDEALKEHFVPEKRPFTPHLTVARLNPPRDLREISADLARTSVVSGAFVVDELVLYRSHLSPRGATYEPLARYHFGGEDPPPE